MTPRARTAGTATAGTGDGGAYAFRSSPRARGLALLRTTVDDHTGPDTSVSQQASTLGVRGKNADMTGTWGHPDELRGRWRRPKCDAQDRAGRRHCRPPH